MWFMYLVIAVAMMLISAFNGGFNPFKIFLPVVFLGLHISYGIGTMVGLASRK